MGTGMAELLSQTFRRSGLQTATTTNLIGTRRALATDPSITTVTVVVADKADERLEVVKHALLRRRRAVVISGDADVLEDAASIGAHIFDPHSAQADILTMVVK